MVISPNFFIISLDSPVFFRGHVILEDRNPKMSQPKHFNVACFLLIWGCHILQGTELSSLLTTATLILVVEVNLAFSKKRYMLVHRKTNWPIQWMNGWKDRGRKGLKGPTGPGGSGGRWGFIFPYYSNLTIKKWGSNTTSFHFQNKSRQPNPFKVNAGQGY